MLISWSHRGRVRSEAAFASLAGVAPLEASSGQRTRHRLNRGGDRDLNRALHTIAITRMRCHPETRDYEAKRTAQGKTHRDIRRCSNAPSPAGSTAESRPPPVRRPCHAHGLTNIGASNGLLRQYFPKGTDLAVHTPADLDAVAAELNDRPRKRLGFRKPIEEIGHLLPPPHVPRLDYARTSEEIPPRIRSCCDDRQNPPFGLRNIIVGAARGGSAQQGVDSVVFQQGPREMTLLDALDRRSLMPPDQHVHRGASRRMGTDPSPSASTDAYRSPDGNWASRLPILIPGTVFAFLLRPMGRQISERTVRRYMQCCGCVRS